MRDLSRPKGTGSKGMDAVLGRRTPLIHVRKQSEKPNRQTIKHCGLHLGWRRRTNGRSHSGCPSLFLLLFCGNGKKVKSLLEQQTMFLIQNLAKWNSYPNTPQRISHLEAKKNTRRYN